MRRILHLSSPMCRSLLAFALLGGLVGAATPKSTEPSRTGPIKQLSLDPRAPIVPLFEGLRDSQFSVRVTAYDSQRSAIFLTNATTANLTAALPKVAVGVHVLPQFQGNLNQFNGANGFFGQPPTNANPNGNSQNTALDGLANMAQSVGGQFTAVSNNSQQLVGFPSIPPELAGLDSLKHCSALVTIPAGQTIQLQLKTVCLNYGKAEPTSRMTYRLLAVEEYSKDPLLAEVLEHGFGRLSHDVTQAAAWHVASGLSWDKLATLPDNRVPIGTSALMFQPRELMAAKELMATATTAVETRNIAPVSATTAQVTSGRRDVP